MISLAVNDSVFAQRAGQCNSACQRCQVIFVFTSGKAQSTLH